LQKIEVEPVPISIREEGIGVDGLIDDLKLLGTMLATPG
jgi:hypothetical protein